METIATHMLEVLLSTNILLVSALIPIIVVLIFYFLGGDRRRRRLLTKFNNGNNNYGVSGKFDNELQHSREKERNHPSHDEKNNGKLEKIKSKEISNKNYEDDGTQTTSTSTPAPTSTPPTAAVSTTAGKSMMTSTTITQNKDNRTNMQTPPKKQKEDFGSESTNNWRCACEGGFLPPGLLKNFAGAEAVFKLGTGDCYHKQM